MDGIPVARRPGDVRVTEIAAKSALNRVRGPRSFYGTASAVVQNSAEAFTALVVSHGRPASDARFLLDKVNVLRDFNPVQRHAYCNPWTP